jgi:GrpB-like predicted nucleotidyltransferase (UPF0157 family)
MARIVVICDYDADWPTRFQHEASTLPAALDGIIIGCHHIGSTTVPGLATKPVIDILLEVSDLGLLYMREKVLCRLDYEALGENNIPVDAFIRKIETSGRIIFMPSSLALPKCIVTCAFKTI